METVVMTGATQGIGAATIRQLVDKDPEITLVLLARSPVAAARITGEVGDGVNVHVVTADLASMEATRRAASEVDRLVARGAVPPVAALALNAGVQCVDVRGASVDGIEMTFAVNVVANHILVRALGPLIAPGGRLIVTVSDTHLGDLRHNLAMVPGPRWQPPERLALPGNLPRPETPRAGRTAYSTSKLAAIYQVHEYARQYPQLTVLGYNPGFVPATGLARFAGPVSRFAMAHLLPLLTLTRLASTADEAGQRLAALTTNDTPVATGGYVDRDRIGASSPESYDADREHDLVRYLDTVAPGTTRA